MNPISKFTLGTVQLGIPYGISNKTGQPNISQSHELLQNALAYGISALDTARQYGASEEVIGSFAEADKFTIISKFKLSDNAIFDLKLAIEEAEKSVKESCQYLKKSTISIFLFHKNPNQDSEQVAYILPKIFSHLKKLHLIEEGGISVFAPSELSSFTNWDNISAIQVPMNILDTRMLQNGFMETLVKNNVKVFIRSIFLQGLLLMKEDDLPKHLQFAREYINQLYQLAVAENLSIREMAFLFVRDCPGVTSMVVGVENLEQLKENMALMSLSGISSKLRENIIATFSNVPEKLITPAFWNN